MRQDDLRKCCSCHRFSHKHKRHKQTDEHKLSHFSLKALFKTVLRMENIGQIYHKHKICEILNCDMAKALERDF